MKHRAAANTVNSDTIDQVRFAVLLPRADRPSEETESVGLYTGEPQPSDVNSNAAGLVQWHQCYGDLWKLKIAFDKEHNR